jgi:hypothetical protein
MSNKYVLQNLDNYNKSINDSYSSILYKYIDIINNYIILSFDYSYLYSNNKIIIKRGISTLFHIFNVIFFYTLNLDLTSYHCDKATYYYIEFISQMTGDNNILQLTGKDVTLFVFKKTIFDLSNDNKIKHSLNKDDKTTIEIIKLVSNIYNHLIYNIIDNENNDLNHYKKMLSTIYKSMNYILSEKIDENNDKHLKNNDKHLKNNDKRKNELILNREKYINKLKLLEFILETIAYKEFGNKNAFIELFIKKIFNLDTLNINNFTNIKNKVHDELFDEYLNDINPNKLVNWLIG